MVELTSGAVKVGFAMFGSDKVTGGPAVCVQLNVNVPDPKPTPFNVTSVPSSTT